MKLINTFPHPKMVHVGGLVQLYRDGRKYRVVERDRKGTVMKTGHPMHVGVTRGEYGYVITAEYQDGYSVLARFETAAAAKAALKGKK